MSYGHVDMYDVRLKDIWGMCLVFVCVCVCVVLPGRDAGGGSIYVDVHGPLDRCITLRRHKHEDGRQSLRRRHQLFRFRPMVGGFDSHALASAPQRSETRGGDGPGLVSWA